MKQILITDSLFIFPEHEQQLQDAGYEVVRLDKPNASEEELCEAVKGKVGYILGGVELVTQKVIDAAHELRAIAFTGIDYRALIPAWEHATTKGITITNTPDGPTNEVAEWALGASLMMNRHFLDLGRVSKETKFMLTKGIEDQSIGIIGFGRIGSRIAELVQDFRPKEVLYFSPHHHEDKEHALGVSYQDLSELLRRCDIVFLCADSKAKNLLSTMQFQEMKPDSLLINITHPGVIDERALYEALASSRIRAMSDHPMGDPHFSDLPLDRWYCMNTSSTITYAGAKLISDTATSSIINVLTTGSDEYKVN